MPTTRERRSDRHVASVPRSAQQCPGDEGHASSTFPECAASTMRNPLGKCPDVPSAWLTGRCGCAIRRIRGVAGAVPPLWLGVLGPAAMLVGGHLPMLPTMAVAMLLHRDEYTGHAVR